MIATQSTIFHSIIPCIIVFTFIIGTHVDTRKEEHIDMQSCGAYEITKPHLQSCHRNLAVVVDENPAQ